MAAKSAIKMTVNVTQTRIIERTLTSHQNNAPNNKVIIVNIIMYKPQINNISCHIHLGKEVLWISTKAPFVTGNASIANTNNGLI